MSTTAGESPGSEIMLFGVRLVVDSMRKSVSLNNLSQYVHFQDSPVTGSVGDKDVTAGYASADEATAVHLRSSSNSAIAASRDRKRGVPWTEEEHKLFLLGLQKVGKGDWRGILRNFVKTRTLTQVASHAQKYFLRWSNLNRRRRRSSLFDITTDTFPSNGVLEIKCPFFDGDMSRALPWKRIPLYYMPQAQGLLEIMDRDWMDFYVWTPNGSSLFRVYRDVEYWALLKTSLSDFWWKHPAGKGDM